MMRLILLMSLSCLSLCVPQASHASETRSAAIRPGDLCDQEKQIEGLLSEQPLICTLGMWRPVRIETKSNGEVKPLFYSGKCKLRLDRANRSNISVNVKAGEIVDICLPQGLRSQLVAVAQSNDVLIAQPPLISNLVIVKPTKKTSTSLWIYPVNEYETDEEKFEIKLIGK